MTTDFRALCAELLRGLDENRHPEVRYPGHLRLVMASARAALALADGPAVPEGREPAAVTKQPSDAEQVLRLAAIIREVDGNHSKGAAALAESIFNHPDFRAALADEPAVPQSREPASVTGQPRPTEDDVEDAAQCIYEAMRFERVETTPAWSELGNSLAQDTARKAARAVLAHWGNPAPAPPADGEVAELVAWLRQEFTRNQQIGNRTGALQSLRAAELLQRQALVPEVGE